MMCCIVIGMIMRFQNYARFDIQLFLDSYGKFGHKYRGQEILRTLAKSVIMDGISPNNIDKHDKMFKAKNKYEQEFWDSCRELAKEDIYKTIQLTENGKKGGRPFKEKS